MSIVTAPFVLSLRQKGMPTLKKSFWNNVKPSMKLPSLDIRNTGAEPSGIGTESMRFT